MFVNEISGACMVWRGDRKSLLTLDNTLFFFKLLTSREKNHVIGL